MEEKLEEIIRSKTWDQLNPDERMLVTEHLGGEEKFNTVRKTFMAIDQLPKVEIDPHPETFRKLQQRMNPHSGSWLQSLFLYRMPAAAAIGIFAIAFVAGWFGKPAQVRPVAVPTERLLVKTDTVFVEAQSDTVYVTRVEYRYIQQKPAQPVFTTVSQTENSRGVSMKDKEELENLLVSGSE